MDKFVFIHIPKATGTTLRTSIESKLEIDRDAQPAINQRSSIRRALPKKLRCLAKSFETRFKSKQFSFGHFYAGCFADFNGFQFKKREGCFYGTVLREPLQRAISHYFYWKRTFISQPLWKEFQRDNWSLDQFLLSEHFSNFQSQFFWRFPLSNLDFIGLAEHFEESVQMLEIAYPPLKGLAIEPKNVNPDRRLNQPYEIDPLIAEKFKMKNQSDYALYAEATELFMMQRRWLAPRHAE
jgi:hypothetical protein